MTSKEAIVGRLGPITEVLADAIPKALDAVKRTADFSALRPFCPIKLSTDFRYEMKLLLKAHKSLIDDISDCEVELTPRDIGNIGLQFTFGGIEAKILKGSNGKLPIAMTDSRVSFYTQEELALGDYTNDEEKPRVIYIWECDSAESSGRAWLVRPKCAKLQSKEIEVHWGVEIPLERRTMKDAKRPTRADLPIGLSPGKVESGPSD
jgi:hypothetical protein